MEDYFMEDIGEMKHNGHKKIQILLNKKKPSNFKLCLDVGHGDINSKNNKSILKKLIQTKKVRSKIIKLKQDINKPDFGRD